MNKHFKQISAERDGLMGIAILSVILYHLYCWTYRTPLLSAFKWGFIGVDVFIFVSAFGLCFSYERNSCAKFYGNRLKRIFPLYLFWALVLSVMKLVFYRGDITSAFKQFIALSTTLSYYLPGFDHSSWFVPAIVLLYIIFPFCYRLVDLLGAKVILPITTISLIVSHFVSARIGWYYDSLISRISIFFLGIIVYHCAYRYKDIHTCDGLMWFVVYILSLSFSRSCFFIATMFCPILIMVIILGLRCATLRMRRYFAWCGMNSYELFLGHILGYNMMRYVEHECMLLLIVGMVFGCAIVYFASKLISGFVR